MKVSVFNTKPYDREFLIAANKAHSHELAFFEPGLNQDTIIMAEGSQAVCVFVNDHLDAGILKNLSRQGTRLIALRCAGFNNVDLAAARDLGLTVVRVPAYSPHSVAEYTVGLILTLNRKIHKAYIRTRESNFELNGLMGFALHGKTVGIIGTGKIGTIVAQILKGFGCHLLAYDKYPSPECKALGVKYVSPFELAVESDIITLHSPLTPESHYLVDEKFLELVKPGVILINTSRGALIDTKAVIKALKSGKIGYLAVDVYEEEEGVFFEDLSDTIPLDDVLARLISFPNVILTGHQAFFTRESMEAIAETTLSNVTDFEQGRASPNEVKAK
jgi:D-lactate dehydrogenase